MLLTPVSCPDQGGRLRLPLPRMGHSHSRGGNPSSFVKYCWQNISGGNWYMHNCKTLIYSGMVSPRWEDQIKFPFDNLIVCITQIKKELVSSWAKLFYPEKLSSASFLPIYDPITEKCTTHAPPLWCKNRWISISGASTQVGGREKGRPLHLLLFNPAEDDDLGLDLDDILLQAKNLINQMLTVNPAKRIRAEEVSDFLISFFSQQSSEVKSWGKELLIWLNIARITNAVQCHWTANKDCH